MFGKGKQQVAVAPPCEAILSVTSHEEVAQAEKLQQYQIAKRTLAEANDSCTRIEEMYGRAVVVRDKAQAAHDEAKANLRKTLG